MYRGIEFEITCADISNELYHTFNQSLFSFRYVHGIQKFASLWRNGVIVLNAARVNSIAERNFLCTHLQQILCNKIIDIGSQFNTVRSPFVPLILESHI